MHGIFRPKTINVRSLLIVASYRPELSMCMRPIPLANTHPNFEAPQTERVFRMLPSFLFALLFFVSIFQASIAAPYQSRQDVRNEIRSCVGCAKRPSTRESKKDIFISRGWGAGGMPFSVLYMNPSFSSSKAPATVETSYHKPQPPPKKQHKSWPQARTTMPNRQKILNRTPHSVIPQLFVSYGWGPLGK